MKIGVFDSGVGGLSILKELYEMSPSNSFYYFSDSRFAPYGNKEEEFIFERCQFITEVFISLEIKHIVIACNTATAWCIDRLRKTYSDITFFGVEPYINIINKSDDYKNKKGVSLVTDLMNNSKRYQDLKDRLDPNGYITSIPLKNLAYDIESHYFQKPNFGSIVEKNLKDKFDLFRDCSYIILGCTHYPIVKLHIEKYLSLPCISPCENVADYVLKGSGLNRDNSSKKRTLIKFFDSSRDDDWQSLSSEQLILF